MNPIQTRNTKKQMENSNTLPSKKQIAMFTSMSEFEDFVNRTDITILQLDLKVVEQSYSFQESFGALVYYEVIKPTKERVYSEEEMKKCWDAATRDALSIGDENYMLLTFKDFIESLNK